MQYHYVVGYDSEMKRWFVELDTTCYFPDGNMWDDQKYRSEFWGWRVPEEGSAEEALDYELLNTLSYIVDIFPIPEDEEDGWKRRTRSPIGSIYADLVKEQGNATS